MSQKLQMGHIFISYSHKDRNYVHQLAETLEQEGFNVWIDDRLDYGTDWPIEIQQRLDNCDALILVMSSRSLISKWVQNELNRALRKEKPIFPLLLEGSEPWLSVESTQFIDVTSGRIPEEKFYARLARVTPRHKKPIELEQQDSGQQEKIETGQAKPSEQSVVLQEVLATHKPDSAKQEKRKRTTFKNWWLPVTLVFLVCVAATLGVAFLGVPRLIEWLKATPSVIPIPATSVALSAIPTTVTTPRVTAPAIPNTPPPTESPGVSTATGGAAETATPVNRSWDEWTVTRSFPSPGSGPTGVVRIGDTVWVIVPGNSRLYRLDLEGNIVAEFYISANQEVGAGLTWDGESLWWATWNRVTQFDPATGTELTQFEAEEDIVEGVAWDGTGLWLVDSEGNLVQYDRAGQRLRRLSIPVDASGATGLVWVEGETWVEDLLGRVERFDSDFNMLGSFNLSQCIGGGPFYSLALYWDGESLWLADPNGNRIYQCTSGD